MKLTQHRQSNGLTLTLILGLGLPLVLWWMMGAGPPGVARAATFTVTKFTDTNDGNCDTDCSLREAIIAANAAGDPDTITLMAGTYELTIPGTSENTAASGDLDITTPLTLVGAGPNLTIIDAGGFDRVFEMHRGTILIADLTIRNGNASALFGGGILNETNLTLSNSIVRNNRAGSGGGIVNRGVGRLVMTNSAVITNSSSGNGGGIVNFSSIALTNSIVSDNAAVVGGGGIYNTSDGALTVTSSSISSNTASSGGGIANSGRELVVTKSTISHNLGDGIFSTSGSNLLITNSTVNGNTGDGIANLASDLTLINSTVSHNSASVGAGIANFGSGVVTITNSTISNNSFGSLGGGIHNFSGTVTLKNTIIANNTTNDCRGVITSNGHNLDRDNSCGLTAVGDLADTNPVLGPLQNNGGDTPTHALLAGSPAIDGADNGVCPATDQRGFIRPVDGDMNGSTLCDMGAHEFASSAPSITSLLHLPVLFKTWMAPISTPTPIPANPSVPIDTPTPAVTSTVETIENRPPGFPLPLKTEQKTHHEYNQFGRLIGAVTTLTISNASDPDGDPITYSWTASNGSIVGNGLTATWIRVVNNGHLEGGEAIIKAEDDHGNFVTFTFEFK